MGADEFFVEAEGATADEAFKKAVEQAQWAKGHAGYTGTIAEKREFIIIPESEWKGEYGARWYARHCLMANDDPRIEDKWGPAGAIQLDEGKWLFFGWASS